MAHIHEQIDFTAEVLVVYNGKVLLRKHDKYDIWLGVGGHIELDEDPNQAAVREVKEEVGLDVVLHNTISDDLPTTSGEQELIPPVFLNRHRISDTHEHIAFVYFATSESDVVVPEKESDQWVWLGKEEVEMNTIGMSDHIQYYARAALNALG